MNKQTIGTSVLPAVVACIITVGIVLLGALAVIHWTEGDHGFVIMFAVFIAVLVAKINQMRGIWEKHRALVVSTQGDAE